VRYFDCGDKSGVFVKKSNVRRRRHHQEEEEEEVESEEKNEAEVRADEELMEENEGVLPVDTRQEQLWGRLLSNDRDFSLERDAFRLLQSLSSSKPHRDMLMNTEALVTGTIGVIQLNFPDLAHFQCDALNLLVSFTIHLQNPDRKLTKLLCAVVESRTRVLQISRDRRLLRSTKDMLALAISGLENVFRPFMDTDEKTRSMKLAADLFVFLADSLYKGPKSRRSSASTTDGVLFYRLSSFFVLSLGSESLSASVLSTRFVSSSIRFVMMTAGLASFDCHIPIAEGEVGGYWNAALSHCLHCLSCIAVQSSQDRLGINFSSLIADAEASPESFRSCLEHVAENKAVGASSVSARQILAKIEIITS